MSAVLYLLKCRFFSRKLYNLVSFLVIAVCVAVLIISLSLANGFERSLIDKIVVVSPHISIFDTNNYLKIPESKLILTKFKIAEVQALMINEKNNYVQGILLRGTNTKNLPALLKGSNILLKGSYPKAGEVIIGSKLSENTRINIGDKIKILTGPSIFIELKVSGIFRVGLYDFDSSVVIAPYEDIITLSPMPGEGMASEVKTFYALFLKDPFMAKAIAESIAKSNYGVYITNWLDDNKSLVSAIAIEKKVIFIVLLLLVIAASVAIANSQFIQIISQQEQIAILSAIGFIPREILATFVLEGLFIAISGSILGVILSLAIVFYLCTYPLPLPMDIYQIETIPVLLNSVDIFKTVAFAAIMVCISCIIPAFYASRLNPVEILRRI